MVWGMEDGGLFLGGTYAIGVMCGRLKESLGCWSWRFKGRVRCSGGNRDASVGITERGRTPISMA